LSSGIVEYRERYLSRLLHALGIEKNESFDAVIPILHFREQILFENRPAAEVDLK
jgi:hypothetical protein